MDIYKYKIQSDEILDKLKLIIVVGVYLKNKNLRGDIWSSTFSKSTLKHLLSGAIKHKARVQQLDLLDHS